MLLENYPLHLLALRKGGPADIRTYIYTNIYTRRPFGVQWFNTHRFMAILNYKCSFGAHVARARMSQVSVFQIKWTLFSNCVDMIPVQPLQSDVHQCILPAQSPNSDVHEHSFRPQAIMSDDFYKVFVPTTCQKYLTSTSWVYATHLDISMNDHPNKEYKQKSSVELLVYFTHSW